MSNEELVEGNIPRISARSDNNGILGLYDTSENKNARHFENFITVNFFGSDGGIFYHPYKASVEMKVHTLKIPNYEFTVGTGLFIANSLKSVLTGFGYGSQLSSTKLKNNNYIIYLPTKNNKIDFEFMESFVAELEAQRVAELEAYLTVTGLKDYELTQEEEKAIEMLEDDIWDSIDVVKLFDVNNTKNILARDIMPGSGDIPYLCASAENNSVSSYINYDDELKDKGNCIFIGGKTFVVSYQEHDFFSNDSHNIALHLIDENKKSRYSHLFLATCVRKSLEHKYSWGDSISNRKIQKDKMTIPFKNGLVDYEFMEIVISAVQKLVIKDVVLWADKKIEATKEIISK